MRPFAVRNPVVTAAVCALFVASGRTLHAQAPFNLTEAQAKNEQLRSRYQWRTRVELRVKGKVWGSAVFISHIDANGKLAQTQVGGGTAAGPDLGLQYFKRQQRQVKKEGLEDLVVDLVRAIRAYTEMPPDQARQAFAGARREPGVGDLAGADRITARNVVMEDDRVTIWVDRQTGIQRRMEIESTAGKHRFSAVWSYAQLPNGPWYAATQVVDVPGEKAQLDTVNSDFLSQR